MWLAGLVLPCKQELISQSGNEEALVSLILTKCIADEVS